METFVVSAMACVVLLVTVSAFLIGILGTNAKIRQALRTRHAVIERMRHDGRFRDWNDIAQELCGQQSTLVESYVFQDAPVSCLLPYWCWCAEDLVARFEKEAKVSAVDENGHWTHEFLSWTSDIVSGHRQAALWMAELPDDLRGLRGKDLEAAIASKHAVSSVRVVHL